MKPGTRELLGKILGVADAALADPRRLVDADVVARLSNEAKVLLDAPHVDGRRLVNHWTMLLLAQLARLAELGPWGDALEAARARRLAVDLGRMVREDLAEALDRAAHPATSEQADSWRAKWPR